MAKELVAKRKSVRRRLHTVNTMSFPTQLRDAIPDLPTYAGRVLKLDSISAVPTHTELYGPRVHVSLVVQETGKLTGEFTVLMDLEVESARALAETLTKLADQSEKLEPTPF
jgi:hypothetical protein